MLIIESEPQQRRRWGRIVARAWDDDDFKQRLLAEPEAVLREAGIEVPPGIEVRVEEGEEVGDTTCLRLPPKPASDDLIDDDLGSTQHQPVARGSSGNCTCRFCALCWRRRA